MSEVCSCSTCYTLFPSLLELRSLSRRCITSAENPWEGSLPHFVYISFLAQKQRIHSHKPSLPKSKDWASFNSFAYFFSAQFLANSTLFRELKIHPGAAWRPSESTKERAAWASYALLSNAWRAFPTNGDALVIGIHKYRNLPFPEAIAYRNNLARSI